MSNPVGKMSNPPDDLKRLGIFGGTFDPVHLGHLICADQLRQALDLDLVLLVPAYSPPHKPAADPAAPEHRLAMVRLAIEGCEGLCESDVEIRRGGTSYTIDTIRDLRRTYGHRTEFWLLMGQDSYRDVSAWKGPDRIAAECFFGVARRPGYKHEERPPVPGMRGKFIDITAVDISSTDIRARLSEARSIRFLVPRKVEDYIRLNGVYPLAPAG
jgi:nicotinate-nucleotide adenylyltransferase